MGLGGGEVVEEEGVVVVARRRRERRGRVSFPLINPISLSARCHLVGKVTCKLQLARPCVPRSRSRLSDAVEAETASDSSVAYKYTRIDVDLNVAVDAKVYPFKHVIEAVAVGCSCGCRCGFRRER